MKTPLGITAALIVRNNADILARCLRSIRPFMEHIVVVDTGSTDATVSIAQSFGAQIAHFKWINDFAIARNVSIDLVQSDWVLWMDSDEWFEPEEAVKLGEAAERKDAAGYELLRRNHMPGGNMGVQAMIRLWRTHPILRMEGQIHEAILAEQWPAAWPDKKIYRSNIFFEHDGFVAEDDAKPLRNLPLLRLEVERDPENLYMLAELYLTLRRLGHEDEAQVVLKNSMATLEKLDPSDRQPGFSAAHIIKILLLKGYPVEQYAKAWYSNVPEIMLALAQSAIEKNDLPHAYSLLSELEELRLAYDWNAYIPMDRKKLEMALATNLALVAHQLGNAPTARSQYLRILSMDPTNEMARNNMQLL